jgi:hypothetical protein
MDAGDDAGHFPVDNEGHGDHGIGLDPEALIKKRAVLGVLRDGVFAHRLARSENVADDSAIEGLAELTNKMAGVRSGPEDRVQELAGGEPESSVLGRDSLGGAGEEFAEEVGGDFVNKPALDPFGRTGRSWIHEAEDLPSLQ